ncbi:MAG: histone deacetylase, partial [Planctomycetota bacterium]
ELVIYLAGADPFVDDRLGRLSLSEEGLRERDRTVYRWAKKQRLPVATAMGGGYAPDVETIAAIHFHSVRSGWEELCG